MPNDHLILLQKMDNCFLKLHGSSLPCPSDISDRYSWLHEKAPYSLLAHNTDADPHFVYANEYALSCFKYNPEEMLCLPSRLSAAEQDRAERQQLLEVVTRDGIAYGYEGPRVDKNGKFFKIYDGILWQLTNDDGSVWGKGALFWTEKGNHPDWYSAVIK